MAAAAVQAADKVNGGLVALKVIKLLPAAPEHTEETTKLLREARLARELDHPNIVPMYGVRKTPAAWAFKRPDGTDLRIEKGELFVVMKFIAGKALNEFLAQECSLFEALEVFREILHGVAFAHSHGVEHRDLKPDNVRIEDTTRRVLVLDLGLAQVKEVLSPDERNLHGTPGYLAPEQAVAGATDRRTDIFTLGVILYEILAEDYRYR